MSNDLREQILSVCDKTHDLLGDPMVQLFGEIKHEKISIEVPKAFSYLALYLSMLNENSGQPVSMWGHHEECFKRKYKGQRSAMRYYLENIISTHMQEELHQLSTLKHPLLTNI